MIEKKKIIGFDNYEIYSDGRVFSRTLSRFLKMKKIGKGYRGYCLTNEAGKHYLYAHRLVAQGFIPNPEDKPQVNHKNGVKTDNCVDNLEWNSSSENLKHAFATGLKNNRHLIGNINTVRKVKQIDLDGSVLRIWNSIAEAGRELGCWPQNISLAATGKLKTSAGFQWSYLEDE